MAEDFCQRALPAIQKLLLDHLPVGASVLDVCCGSGQMAGALVSRGYRMTGLDASAAMLRIGKENVPEADFMAADARDFQLETSFDAAISTFNSLAHIELLDDLISVFRNIRQALRAGGTLLFDLSMEEAYRSKWRGSFALVADDHACVVSPVYDSEARIGTNRITLFEIENGAWLRSDFEIRQTCHAERDVCYALHKSGYDDVSTFDAQRDLGMAGESGRTFFVCR